MSKNNSFPMNWDDEQDNTLLENLFVIQSNTIPNLNSKNSESVKTNKSFEEISSEIVFENPFGGNSIFNEIDTKDFKSTKIL